ncbi:MAG: hypothetical protein GX058_00455 [Firmicutes bacterium]|nr:hypothetical protein [Bacillota bacterium]
MTTRKINLDWNREEGLDWDDEGTFLESWYAVHDQCVCVIERIAREAYAHSVIHGNQVFPGVEDSLASSWEEAEAKIKAIIDELDCPA